MVATRAAGEPIMAIVSLGSQRITVYDGDGWIMQAPVSSGQAGRETPAGIFSVVQKTPSTTRTCMMTPTCPTCSDLRGRGLLCMGVRYRDIRRRTGAFVFPTALPHNFLSY